MFDPPQVCLGAVLGAMVLPSSLEMAQLNHLGDVGGGFLGALFGRLEGSLGRLGTVLRLSWGFFRALF